MVKTINTSPVLVSTTGHFISGSSSSTGQGYGGGFQFGGGSGSDNSCDLCEETQKIYDVVKDIQSLQLETAQGYIPVDEQDLQDIYDKFITPYLNCEPYKVGSIQEAIRLREIIDKEIESAKTEKAKFMLNILKDVLTVTLNARNDKITIIQLEQQIKTLQEKYKNCTTTVEKLQLEIDLLMNDGDVTKVGAGVTRGKLSITTKKIRPIIYFTARFNLVEAWYQYLYDTCHIDPDKYAATIAYVKSFECKGDAYKKLIELLDEKYAEDLDSYLGKNN